MCFSGRLCTPPTNDGRHQPTPHAGDHRWTSPPPAAIFPANRLPPPVSPDPLGGFVYKCKKCGAQSAPRVKAQRLPLESRAVSYPFRSRVNYVPWRPPAERWVDDPGGRGRELVKEIVVCEKCAASVM